MDAFIAGFGPAEPLALFSAFEMLIAIVNCGDACESFSGFVYQNVVGRAAVLVLFSRSEKCIFDRTFVEFALIVAASNEQCIAVVSDDHPLVFTLVVPVNEKVTHVS
jgi:hypothetical protein